MFCDAQVFEKLCFGRLVNLFMHKFKKFDIFTQVESKSQEKFWYVLQKLLFFKNAPKFNFFRASLLLGHPLVQKHVLNTNLSYGLRNLLWRLV